MSSAHLDRVAEAICGVTSAGKMFPWSELTEPDKGAWRAMAQAAIEALELTRDIGYTLKDVEPEDGEPHAWFNECDIRDDEEIAELLNDRRKLWHRLVSPWRAGGED